jgi:hypothetical protein
MNNEKQKALDAIVGLIIVAGIIYVLWFVKTV